MRTKKALYNTISSLLYEAVAAVSGLILTLLILRYFGSSTNGLIASITQFIAYISLFSAGVGGATQAALYKPLADNDKIKISGIMRATELFMRKVALFFTVGLFFMAALYPFVVRKEFDWFFTFTLVLILGAGAFIQCFFEITYLTLLIADQRGYLPTLVRIGATVLNTVIAVVMIYMGCEIRTVKLVSALVFMITPLFLYIYVRKHYKLIPGVPPDNNAIKQRWNAFVDQASWFIYNSFDIVLIGFFYNQKEVSVYTTYYIAARMVRLLITSFGGSNISAPFGDMLAKNQHERLKKNLRLYEFFINSASVILFACTAVLTVPFVSVFTTAVSDANYYRPLLAYLICASEFVTVFSFPYCAPVLAAGHFRQIRKDAIAQTCISIAFSIILIQFLGLTGVVIGKLCAMIYRTARYIIYMSRNVVKRSMWIALRNLTISLVNAAVIIGVALFIPKMAQTDAVSWVLYAAPIFAVAVIVTGIFSALFYLDETRMLIKKAHSILRKSSG